MKVHKVIEVLVEKGKVYSKTKTRDGGYYLISKKDFDDITKNDFRMETIYIMGEDLKDRFPSEIEIKGNKYYRNGEMVEVESQELLVRYPTLEVELEEINDEVKNK